MNLDKLSIFSKDTDAAETVRGYEYQKLRTLAEWITNYLAKNSEVVYCDYEEDIFERDTVIWRSRFTQLKLYSSKNFSFKSIEVTKAISHFFMLFVKGEYKFDEVQFVFETNSSIAQVRQDNDAALLQSWNENQGQLDDTLLMKCAEKVRQIVLEYVEESAKGNTDMELLKQMQDARILLDKLPEDVWQAFAKTISWKFGGITSEEAIEASITEIYQKIESTNFPLAVERKEEVFARLYYEVVKKSTAIEPDERRLDVALMDSLLLDSSDANDKLYNEDYRAWSEATEIIHFRAAEFFQVINSANYCRHAGYLMHHDSVWVELIKKFIALNETPALYKQKAIYELLWLSLRPELLQKPNGSLVGLENFIRQFFGSFRNFADHESLEDVLNVIGIVLGSVAFNTTNIESEEVQAWQMELHQLIETGLKNSITETEGAYFHELAANSLLMQVLQPNYDELQAEALQHLHAIVSRIPRTPTYNVVQLANRVNSFIKILISQSGDNAFIDQLEEVSETLLPIMATRMGNYDLAKQYVQKGYSYLQSNQPTFLLRCLNNFHKAKLLYRDDNTNEGYVLALLNVSQVYTAISCHFAAKYYALSAAWHCTQHVHLLKRLPQALGLVFHSDFKAGAWLTCLEDFRFFMIAKGEFQYEDWREKDDLQMTGFAEIAGILTLTPVLSNQFNGLIQFVKHEMGELYEDFLSPLTVQLDQLLDTEIKITRFITNKLDDVPLNDAGPTRAIQWKALGITWVVKFANTWKLNSLGEEFVAMLQILLVEFALLGVDMHLLKGEITINLEEAENWKQPVKQPSNAFNEWAIGLPSVDTEDYERIKQQPAFIISALIVVLDEMSLLPRKELSAKLHELFAQHDLASKTCPDFLYQRIYRKLFREEEFRKSQRDKFEPLHFSFLLREFQAQKWNDAHSDRYTPEKSLELIRGRYEHAMLPIHLTLSEIKNDERYESFIQGLRDAGWLDWQILVAMHNHVANHKGNKEIAEKRFNTEEEHITAFQTAFHKYSSSDEADYYEPIILDFFLTEEFQTQLTHIPLIVLKNWGLESKSETPNFAAIKDLLIRRFNFKIDDEQSLSPL